MKAYKWRLILSTMVVMALSLMVFQPSLSLGNDSVPPAELSPPEDIALNPSRSGYPHPLESDRGWGGGSDKWEIVDGVRRYSEWYHGLAFTGGRWPYIEPCGWRQATINFGEPKTFNRVLVWHHGLEHVPNTYKIQYWDGTSWVDIFSTADGHAYLKYPADPPDNWWESFSTPTENTFDPVTSSKVRFALYNCDIVHGWIYEFEVYGPLLNLPPVADAGGPYEANEGDTVTLDASGSSDPDDNIVLYEWDLDNDGEYDDATGVTTEVVFDDDGAFTVGLRVTDEFDESDTDTAEVAVLNVAPAVNAGSDATIYSGETFTVNASFTDPGVLDTHTATIDFRTGDGPEWATVVEEEGSGTVTGSHRYFVPDTYTVEVCVTDDDEGTGCDSLSVAAIAYADGAVLSMYVAAPPAEIAVSDWVPIFVVEDVVNNGPFGPAEFDVTFNATAPAGCEIMGSAREVERVTLDLYRPEPVVAVFLIHCFEPSFHTFEFDNEITPVDPHVEDPEPGNNTGATSLTVASIAQADGEVVSMNVVNPPLEIDVSDEVRITVREVVHNFGDTVNTPPQYSEPSEFDVTFNAAAPDGCEIVGEDEKVVRVNLPVCEDTEVDATFTIHCSEPSLHTFTFDNEIAPVDPHVVDPNSDNNTGATSLTVAAIAQADGAVRGMFVVNPPAEIDVSDEVNITVREVVHNFGDPNYDEPSEFDVTFNAAAPDGCEIVGEDEKVVRVTLRVSEDTNVDASFTIHCSEPSLHTFEFDNVITPVDPHVEDPEPGNNTGATSLTVAAIAQADLAIQSWDFDLGPDPAPLGLADLELDISEPFWFPTIKVVHNFGDTVNTPPQYSDPVDANVWKTMVIPAGIEGSVHVSEAEAPATIVIEYPDGTTEVLEDQEASIRVAVEGPAKLSVHFKVPALEVCVERSISEEFDLHCLKPGFHDIRFTNEIMAEDEHIRDPKPDNNVATRDLSVLCLNHYLGYDIKHVEPKFEKREVTLTDQFVDGNFVVYKPDRLYTPADKEMLPDQADFAQVEGVETHLKRYKLKDAKDGPKKIKVKDITVTNQFGEFLVEAHGPYYLMVPTTKALLDEPLPGQPTERVDHYLCYKLKKVKVREDVSIADQFGTHDYEVKYGVTLCNPVEKQVVEEDGSVTTTPIQNPGLHLMCFDVKGGEKVNVEVNTNNQFGPESLTVYKPKELCVPSFKIAPEPPEPEDKCKGIAMIELAYSGELPVEVEVKKFGTFTLADPGDTILLEAEEGKKLPSDIKLKIDGEEVAKFHTSCSKPIEIGDVSGPFEIVDLDKLY